jgi:HdeA/HdeB family protein
LLRFARNDGGRHSGAMRQHRARNPFHNRRTRFTVENDRKRTSVDLDQHKRARDSAFLRPCGSPLEIIPGRSASRTTPMRCRLISLTFAVWIIPVVANAQVTIDMGKIICSQYLAMPQSQSDKFSAWMSGWFSYQNSRTFVDLALHQRNIASVKAWCQYHPAESVMYGLQQSVGKN